MRADDHGASPPRLRLRQRRQVNLRDITSEFPLPVPDQPNVPGSGSARLLPTPAAGNPNDSEDTTQWLARQARHRDRRINGNGMGMPLSVAVRLLPTPLASEARAGSPNQHYSSGQPGLTATVLRLLPTPRASGNRNSRTAVTVHRSGPGLEQAVELVLGLAPTELTVAGTPPPSWTTPGAAAGDPATDTDTHTGTDTDTDTKVGTEVGGEVGGEIDSDTGPGTLDWGAYTPAIRRWTAALGRTPPHPTEPGRTGRPRLAAVFVEWLMGLEAGWVTATGLTRAAQIRTLGNGVVPAQAATALGLLLADLIHDTTPIHDSTIGREDISGRAGRGVVAA